MSSFVVSRVGAMVLDGPASRKLHSVPALTFDVGSIGWALVELGQAGFGVAQPATLSSMDRDFDLSRELSELQPSELRDVILWEFFNSTAASNAVAWSDYRDDALEALLELRNHRSMLGRGNSKPIAADPGDGIRAQRTVLLTPASRYEPEGVEWVWEDRIPVGAVTLIAGIGGLGKSSLAVRLAALLTKGRLSGDRLGKPTTVLYASAEDGWPRVVVPRLMAADANLDRVFDLAVSEVSDPHGLSMALTLPEDIELLRDAVDQTGASLVVIDPMVAHLSDGIDSHRDHEVRRALGALHQLAVETELAVLGIVHLNKSNARSAMGRISGSVGFYNAARSVLLFTEELSNVGPGDEARLLSHPKSNLGPVATTLRYRVEQAVVVSRSEELETVRLEYVGEAPDIGAAEALVADGARKDTALAEASAFLARALGGGPVRSTVLFSEAEEAGIALRTLRRAKSAVGVRVRKDGPNGAWRWHPPDDEARHDVHSHVGRLGNHGWDLTEDGQGSQDSKPGVSDTDSEPDDVQAARLLQTELDQATDIVMAVFPGSTAYSQSEL